MHMAITARWVQSGDADHETGIDPERHVGWCGGDPSNPTWDEYLDEFNEGAQAVILAVREAVERDGLDVYGEDFDYHDGYFALSDGRCFSCSMRAWGDLRQAMVGKREGYMRYYMRFCAGLPDGPVRP
jgi:hypothetical protein